jgi:RNA-binding protein YhbY
MYISVWMIVKIPLSSTVPPSSSEGGLITDVSELEEIRDHNEQRERREASVQSLISAAKQHPTLQSLCGIYPDPDNSGYLGSNNLNKFLRKNFKKNFENKNVLNLCNQGIDDLMAMVVSYDLKHNHNIISVNIDNNCIAEKNSLINSIKDNITLKSIYCNYQNIRLPNSRYSYICIYLHTCIIN